MSVSKYNEVLSTPPQHTCSGPGVANEFLRLAFAWAPFSEYLCFLRIFSQLRGKNVRKRAISTLLNPCFQADSCVVLSVMECIYWCLDAVLLISLNLTHSALKYIQLRVVSYFHDVLPPTASLDIQSPGLANTLL